MEATEYVDSKSMKRCITLDVRTNEMLKELAGGRVSAYLRQLILLEFGKKLERETRRGDRRELAQSS